MTSLRISFLALTLAFTLATPLAIGRADDEPVGTVIEPSDVTSAPTDESSAANAGGGFDTPADAVETDSGDLQPNPFTAMPNE